jgi:hypothetical protein
VAEAEAAGQAGEAVAHGPSRDGQVDGLAHQGADLDVGADPTVPLAEGGEGEFPGDAAEGGGLPADPAAGAAGVGKEQLAAVVEVGAEEELPGVGVVAVNRGQRGQRGQRRGRLVANLGCRGAG